MRNKILDDNSGNRSSKRFAGISLLAIGIIAKSGLIIYGASIRIAEEFTIYDKIDSSADSLIVAGTLLLGAGVAELFAKKK